MQILSRIVMLLSVTMMVNMVAPAFAEAPVYDADSLPQQFDPSGDADQQDLPPPPPPAQQGAYVPHQAPIASSDSSAMSIEQRMRRMEQQMNNVQSTDLVQRMDALQDQVQVLRGQVEQLTHQLQQVQNQPKVAANDETAAKALALPVDAKPRKVAVKQVAKAAPAPSATDADSNASSVAAGSGGQPNVAEEQQIYQTAYNLIKAKKYDDAISTLQGMLKKYPSGQFASNAHYWLGELYGLMSKNDQALTEFSTVLKNYPDSPRLSDAQLKLGLIYASQSKWSDAKSAFKKVINRYPGTASARLAAEHLKQIRQAGN